MKIRKEFTRDMTSTDSMVSEEDSKILYNPEIGYEIIHLIYDEYLTPNKILFSKYGYLRVDTDTEDTDISIIIKTNGSEYNPQIGSVVVIEHRAKNENGNNSVVMNLIAKDSNTDKALNNIFTRVVRYE